MKVSIVIAVLNSHEIVRRQMLWFKKMDLPDDIEIIFMDDGSNPPLSCNGVQLNNFCIYPTNDFRPWTQPMARNMGARIATGEYLICTDIDHILTRELIDAVYNTSYDVVRFRRQVAILTEDAEFTQDRDALVAYGFPSDRIDRRSFKLSAHTNSYAIRRDLFIELGGSQQKDSYPNRDEAPIKRKWKRLRDEGKITITPDEERPWIYMIPNGRFCGDKDYNPFNLFHNLSRKHDGT